MKELKSHDSSLNPVQYSVTGLFRKRRNTDPPDNPLLLVSSTFLPKHDSLPLQPQEHPSRYSPSQQLLLVALFSSFLGFVFRRIRAAGGLRVPVLSVGN